jgi:flagellar basal body rod protein FlgG
MAGGAYSALSGLRTRMEQLDRIAADIANASTAGYKTERVPTAQAPRPDFGDVLQTAIDVSAAPGLIDFRQGSVAGTGRDLDFAIEGRGFFEIETANGLRYTRNGQFNRRADGVLVTADGQVVRGEGGPITVGTDAAIAVEPDGTVRSGGAVAGRFRIVDVPDYVALRREDGARFRVEGGQTVAVAPGARVRSGALEGSNVSMPERMVQLTEVARAFEALQRGVTTLMNDIDGRAISELGRR